MGEYCCSCMEPLKPGQNFCAGCGSAVNPAVAAYHLVPGSVLAGRYLVGCALGEGGFGITYIGRDLRLDMKVAIKEYFPNGFVYRGNETSAEVHTSETQERKDFFRQGKDRFLQEARVLAKFAGEQGIVSVRDFFEENNTAYIIMEYLQGQTLKSYLESRPPLPAEQALELLMPVMESLEKVHAQGLIHRDISPDNIMLTGSGVKLLDFGAARSVSSFENRSLSVMLKPGYAPEEQYRTKGVQGPWTDVYALCATLYRCITGTRPDDATQRVFSDDVKTPSSMGIPISPITERALMKGLSVRQADRYQTIRQLLEGFRGIEPPIPQDTRTLTGQTLAAPPPLPPDPLSQTRTQAAIPENTPPAKPMKQRQKAAARQHKKPKKKLWLILAGSIAAGLALLIGVIVLIANSRVTVCGDTIQKDETYVYLYKKTLAVEDMQQLSRLSQLTDLSLEECVLPANGLDHLDPEMLEKLTLDNCTGLQTLAGLGNLEDLYTLSLHNCGIDDAMMSGLPLHKLTQLSILSLQENPALSDISVLEAHTGDLEVLVLSGTAVADLSPLKNCRALQNVDATGCKIRDLSFAAGLSNLQTLTMANNHIADISPLNSCTELRFLDLSGNPVSNIAALGACAQLRTLSLADCEITSVAPLATCTQLELLRLQNNALRDLEGLQNKEQLTELNISGNQISSLAPLALCVYLEELYATNNQLTSLEGLENTSKLTEIHFSGNQLTDISLLANSAGTLTQVYLNRNQISDLTPLAEAHALKVLSIDSNLVTSLTPLKGCTELQKLSAEYNRLTSLDGIQGSNDWTWLSFTGNQISDLSVFDGMYFTSGHQLDLLDLSRNQISVLELPYGCKYGSLVIYGNPLTDISILRGDRKGSQLLLDHVEGTDYNDLAGVFSYYVFTTDFPPDQKVAMEEALGKGWVSYTAFDAMRLDIMENQKVQLPEK